MELGECGFGAKPGSGSEIFQYRPRQDADLVDVFVGCGSRGSSLVVVAYFITGIHV